jgi:hypothetical protein
MDRNQSELYEPLPDLATLPGWLWRKTSRPVRIALGLLLTGAIVAWVLLAPEIGESNREREAAQTRARAEQHAQLVRAQRVEQAPRHRETRHIDPGSGTASTRLAARVQLLADMRTAVLADARRRERAGELDGPMQRVECERFPRAFGNVSPERQLSNRTARYACLVVTSQFEGGVIGHTYRSKLAFHEGAYAFCKISGRPGVERDPEVTTPKACGG